MNRRDLELHLQDLFDGRLEGGAFEALARELRADPEAREAYREYFHLHHALRFRGKGVDLLNVVPMDRVIQRRQRRELRTAGLAAAAVIMLGALVMALILTRTPKPTLTFRTNPGTEFITTHRLTGDEAPRGQALEPGSRMDLLTGTVELEFDSGVRAIVRGPAKLMLVREDLLNLERGTVWLHVPSTEAGFQLTTRELIATDLGTEFGVISNPNFPDEVHVFAGRVEVRHRNRQEQPELLEEGKARMAEPTGRFKAIPVRPEQFLTKLPETEPERSVIVTEEAGTEEFAFAGDVSDSDLIEGLVPSAEGWNTNNNASPNELTDGIHGAGLGDVPGDRVQGAWTRVGATAEFHLGTGPNGLGYDITSVQSIASWAGEGFANQCWSISLKPVGGRFQALAEVSFAPFETQNLSGGGSTKVTLTDKSGLLGRGIESIRIVAGHVPTSAGNAFVWRELDVFGEAAEPTQ